jgi:hypothetical protein
VSTPATVPACPPSLLARYPAQARQIARKLVEGRLTLTPPQDERRRFYEVNGQGTLGRVLAGTFLAKAMVTPAGYDRPWTVEIHGLVRAS